MKGLPVSGRQDKNREWFYMVLGISGEQCRLSGGVLPRAYDTSQPALDNFATGNHYYDCRKFGAEDVTFLCYLASDRDVESAEAALDRLRELFVYNQIDPYHALHVYQTAMLIKLGSDYNILRAAAGDLLFEMGRNGQSPNLPGLIPLTQSTGFPALDSLLSRVVADLVGIFGERLYSCYAVGSAFDGSGVESSDVDLHLLFKGAHSSRLKQAVQCLSRDLSEEHGVDLDLIPFFESDINPWADVRTKLGGRQIFGQCSPDILVLPPIDEYVREMMHKAYYYLCRVRGFPDSLAYPLSAPNGQDCFNGYVVRTHDDGSPSTKELVVVAGWVSTALVVAKAHCYIPSKSASYDGYCWHVNDAWTVHLQDVFELVRKRWNYRLPESEIELARLAAISRRQVDFENHFLLEYRKFLQEECAYAAPHHAKRAAALLQELFSSAGEPGLKQGFRLPTWQVSCRKRELDPRLTSAGHFIVKVPSLRNLDNKAIREAFQRFDEFGVVIFDCRDTLDLKYDLLGLTQHFGEVVFHPRSDKTGISSVRNQFVRQEKGFVGTTNTMQTMHTDGSFLQNPPGIVALQAEICGLCGGESTLVFGDTLYCYMKREHPAELEALFCADAYTIGREGELCTRPVFWHEEGRIHLAYRKGNGEYLVVAPWARKGFNKIYDFVNDPANQVRFRLPANHVLVVDNRRNFHGRLRWPPDTVRCLNRLWLNGNGTHSLYPGLGIRCG